MKTINRFVMLALALLALVGPQEAAAQLGEDLYLYGFFQGQYRYSSEQGLESPDEVSSFSLQQLNAFLMKDFNASFSAFVNAELTNSFATDKGWGSLRLEEAWMRYNRSAKFNVKAGLLVPAFNNLNEVKNRTPLLPYVFRPIAYESSFSSVINLEGLAPGQAFLQVNGALPLGSLRFDYAAYVGNNSTAYAADRPFGSVVPGTDLSTAKLVGGRFGLRWRSLKAGVSATKDETRADYHIDEILNQSPAAIEQFSAMLGTELQAITPEVLAMAGLPSYLGLDEVGRTRLGLDLSFNKGRFFGEGELIRVKHDLTDEHSTTLFVGGQLTGGFIRDDVDMTFYYSLLGFNVTDRLFTYGFYNYLQDNSNYVQAAGLDFYTVGAGFRPIDGVVVKGQYAWGGTRENLVTDYRTNTFFGAISVFF